MDLFEYQGKQYFARFGIPTSKGGVADTVDEAVEQADQAGYPVVVKAQVKVGGRGKAGGVKLANDAEEVRTAMLAESAGADVVVMSAAVADFRPEHEAVAKLKKGMTKSEVKLLLGTPLLNDAFHANRWDYFFSNVKGGKPEDRTRLTIFFEDDKLVSVMGDVRPAAAAQVAPKAVAPTAPAQAATPPPAPAKK